MKIKKINDDKVQIIITNQDLEERDFKKWELMPLSPKAQELFQDLLDMAYEECGFEIEDDSQLMVEAYPLSVDSFVVVMTKVRSNYGGEHLNLYFPLQHEAEEADDRLERSLQQVWSFPDLETCCQACSRLDPSLIDTDTLYKYQDHYYLAITILPEGQHETTALLGEYGEWHPVHESFLKEYAAELIARGAVSNLASLIR